MPDRRGPLTRRGAAESAPGRSLPVDRGSGAGVGAGAGLGLGSAERRLRRDIRCRRTAGSGRPQQSADDEDARESACHEPRSPSPAGSAGSQPAPHSRRRARDEIRQSASRCRTSDSGQGRDGSSSPRRFSPAAIEESRTRLRAESRGRECERTRNGEQLRLRALSSASAVAVRSGRPSRPRAPRPDPPHRARPSRSSSTVASTTASVGACRWRRRGARHP